MNTSAAKRPSVVRVRLYRLLTHNVLKRNDRNAWRTAGRPLGHPPFIPEDRLNPAARAADFRGFPGPPGCRPLAAGNRSTRPARVPTAARCFADSAPYERSSSVPLDWFPIRRWEGAGVLVKLWHICWRAAIWRALFRLIELPDGSFERRKGFPNPLGPKRGRHRSPF